MSCQRNNKPGFKYGEDGHCYTYKEGDEASRKRAIAKAQKQGRAIALSKARAAGHKIPRRKK